MALFNGNTTHTHTHARIGVQRGQIKTLEKYIILGVENTENIFLPSSTMARTAVCVGAVVYGHM